MRAPGGCPWDAEQTHESIRTSLIEETYEVVEAIDKKDAELLCEELGDLWLQIIMHIEMEREVGRFSEREVLSGICRKLIRRHPHVFGDVVVGSSEEVLRVWDAVKQTEKKREGITGAMRALPPGLPALIRARKIASKADREGFAYPDDRAAFAKIEEELDELREAATAAEQTAAVQATPEESEEFGDLLFSAVAWARRRGIDAEAALSAACDKFIDRFSRLEAMEKEDIGRISREKLAADWEKVKKSPKI